MLHESLHIKMEKDVPIAKNGVDDESLNQVDE
jgi:hypothetical protein